MSTRSNYFTSRPTLYPLITIPTTPTPKMQSSYSPCPSSEPTSASSDVLRTPRQRKGRRPRGLSILIPPPLEKLQKVEIVVTYLPSKPTPSLDHTLDSIATRYPNSSIRRSSRLYDKHQENLENNNEDLKRSIQMGHRLKYLILLCTCLALVTMGFTMLILVMIIPVDNLSSFLRNHLH